MAVMAGTYLAIDRMSLKNGGSGGLIINTASAAGIIFGDGTKELAEADSYFVAKHGVVALTKALAVSIGGILDFLFLIICLRTRNCLLRLEFS